jgi:hypothetical protein
MSIVFAHLNTRFYQAEPVPTIAAYDSIGAIMALQSALRSHMRNPLADACIGTRLAGGHARRSTAPHVTVALRAAVQLFSLALASTLDA